MSDGHGDLYVIARDRYIPWRLRAYAAPLIWAFRFEWDVGVGCFCLGSQIEKEEVRTSDGLDCLRRLTCRLVPYYFFNRMAGIKPMKKKPNQSLQTISCSVTVAAEPLCVPPHEMSDLKRSAKINL